MAETIEDVKRRLRTQFLGKAGIHGFGIRRARNAICVYLDPDSDADRVPMLSELEREAAPYPVIPIKEQRPSIT